MISNEQLPSLTFGRSIILLATRGNPHDLPTRTFWVPVPVEDRTEAWSMRLAVTMRRPRQMTRMVRPRVGTEESVEGLLPLMKGTGPPSFSVSDVVLLHTLAWIFPVMIPFSPTMRTEHPRNLNCFTHAESA